MTGLAAIVLFDGKDRFQEGFWASKKQNLDTDEMGE
jgi:hypothetical protein